jgi:hypothetical protein
MIHNLVEKIPPPKPINAIEVLEELNLLERRGLITEYDGIEDRLLLLIALFSEKEPATALGLQKQLEVVHDYYEPS